MRLVSSLFCIHLRLLDSLFVTALGSRFIGQMGRLGYSFFAALNDGFMGQLGRLDGPFIAGLNSEFMYRERETVG